MKLFKLFRMSIFIVLMSLLCFGISQPAFAEYPEESVDIICWSSPGAPNDLLARQIAKIGKEYFGVNMNVKNRPGGGGATAMSNMLSQDPDGHTFMTTTASQVIRMAGGQVPFSPSDFKYIMRIQMDPFVIAVQDDAPYDNLKEFFEYAKENPGELSIGGYGTASAHFLAYKRLELEAGEPDIKWVAYDGGADAAVATLGGHTDAVHTNALTVKEHVEAGDMKVLGISAAERVSLFPDWETYTEQGYDLAPVHWRGVMASAEVSDDRIQEMRDLMEQVVEDPDFKKFMKNAGVEYALMDSPAEFNKWVAEETKANRKLMKDLDLIE